METKAQAHKALMITWEKEREARDIERRREEEIEKKKEQDLANFKQLLNEAQQWHQTNILSQYIDRIETKAVASNALTEGLKNWLAWACLKADNYNPLNKVFLTGGDDEALEV